MHPRLSTRSRIVALAAASAAASIAYGSAFYNFEHGIQGWHAASGVVLSQGTIGATSGRHSLKVSNYKGGFVWLSSSDTSGGVIPALHSSSTVYFDLTATQDILLKKDRNGNQWFSFVLAEQGGDYKWNQTTTGTVVPLRGGALKAGTYTVAINISALPHPPLTDKVMNFSLGPGTSGLAKPITFYIDNIRTTKNPRL